VKHKANLSVTCRLLPVTCDGNHQFLKYLACILSRIEYRDLGTYILYIFIFYCNWVATRWQQYSTHLHTNSTQNTENGTYITLKKTLESAGRPLSLRVILEFALQLRKKHGETSVRVAEKFPDIPVAAVQYTFTHKQYTEHTERNTHNNRKKKNWEVLAVPRFCDL
jgi:hypothetical protein